MFFHKFDGNFGIGVVVLVILLAAKYSIVLNFCSMLLAARFNRAKNLGKNCICQIWILYEKIDETSRKTVKFG